MVIADPIDARAVDRLSRGPCRVVDATAGPEALAAYLPEAWALVVRSRTKVSERLLAAAPNLRVIARAGVGVDNVDLVAATRRRILVVNTPTAVTTSVAELTVAFALMLVRDLWVAVGMTKGGLWNRGVHGGELADKTVGLIGYGRVGREVGHRLRALGASIVAYDPLLPASPDETPLVPLEELLAQADIVSLHAALTPENHHLLDADRIGRMRRGAFLINLARGALIDEPALLRALDSGQLAGAALDVFEVEPPTGNALLVHPNVLATPHIGASTREAQARAGAQVVDELLRLLGGERPRSLVNTELESRS